MSKKLTTEEFISRAKEIHRDFYNYSDVKYINSKTKVRIICPNHGEFLQLPFDHLYGKRCPKCANKYSPTTEEFIQQAKEIHRNRYDYSETEYLNRNTAVKIICPEHGEFFQTPKTHLKGCGCKLCSGMYKSNKEEFVEKSTVVHGSKYDYSQVEYVNNKTKVEIICPKHGSFFQTPSNHLLYGCPNCKNNSRITPFQEFVGKASKIHNNRYDYVETSYVKTHDKMTILCQKHGPFTQSPHSHLQGNGCPKCGIEKQIVSKRINKTFNTSSIEDNLSILLESKFSKVFRQYNRDPRYPYQCDFYIPERDMFIELNAFWTHDTHWYNPNSSRDRTKRKQLLEKYKKTWGEFAWWTSDIKKRNAAKKNNLNYVVLWNEQDIDDWFTLDCPNGHDGDGMYTWKE